MIAYLDTSAAMKLLIEEDESAALLDTLTASPRTLVASWLLHTELHCAAGRNPVTVRTDAVNILLNTVNLVDSIRGDFVAAGTHAPLRSNDALHLAVTIRVGADEMITYDRELADAARRAGVQVVAPH